MAQEGLDSKWKKAKTQMIKGVVVIVSVGAGMFLWAGFVTGIDALARGF